MFHRHPSDPRFAEALVVAVGLVAAAVLAVAALVPPVMSAPRLVAAAVGLAGVELLGWACARSLTRPPPPPPGLPERRGTDPNAEPGVSLAR